VEYGWLEDGHVEEEHLMTTSGPAAAAAAARKRPWVALLLLAAALLGGASYLVVRAKAYLWLPDYARHLVEQRPSVTGTRHLIFLFVDHYEPGRGELGVARNREWISQYRALAGKHRDSYGRRPQHTWFYPFDHQNEGVMRDLSRASFEGLGEVELHWHHGNDTNQSLPPKLSAALAWFRSFGALVSQDGKTSFGFIHGNWALDNSRKPELCGVSRELTILKEAGCYADFTFPSVGDESQPRKVNSIYYAIDDDRPKSYDQGTDARVGQQRPDGFLLLEGPVALKLGRQFTEGGNIEVGHEASPERIDRWVRANIHVKGRPEWVFVKIHTHGFQSRSAIFSEETDALLSQLERSYGSGDWRLHYVTAREAYNLVRAAEDGLSGDPDAYRDYQVKRPVNVVSSLD
jgi:hypothetical protein